MLNTVLSKRELSEADHQAMDAEAAIRQTPGYLAVRQYLKEAGYDGKRGSSDVSYARAIYQNLKESFDASMTPLLVTGLADATVNDMYQPQEISYDKYTRKVTTDKPNYFTDPLWLPSLPGKIIPGEDIQRGSIADNPHQITVFGLGLIESFSAYLWADDQTGQIPQRLGKMGQSHAIWWDLWFTGMLYGGDMTFEGVYSDPTAYRTKILVSDATFTTGIYHKQKLTTGEVIYDNVLTNDAGNACLKISVQSILAAAKKFKNELKDPLKKKLRQTPKTLIVASDIYYDTLAMVRSMTYPTIPGKAGETLSTVTAGTMGNVGGANPIQWMPPFDVVENINLPDGAWFMTSGTGMECGLVNVVRSPIMVIAAPPDGYSRFYKTANDTKSEERGAGDWIEGRSIVAGNWGKIGGTAVSITVDGVAITGV